MLPPQLWIAKKAGGFLWRQGRRVARRRAARRLSFLGMTPKRRGSAWRPAAVLLIMAGAAAAAELLRRAGGEGLTPTPSTPSAPEPVAAPPEPTPEPVAAPPEPEPMAMAPETLAPVVEPPLSAGSAGAAGPGGEPAGGTVSEPLDLLDPAATPPETAPVEPVQANQSLDPVEDVPTGTPAAGRPEPTPSTSEEVTADPDPDPITLEPDPVTPDDPRPDLGPGTADRSA